MKITQRTQAEFSLEKSLAFISSKTETRLGVEICNRLKMYLFLFLNSFRILLHNCVYFLVIPASWETKTIHKFRVKIQFSQMDGIGWWSHPGRFMNSLTKHSLELPQIINVGLYRIPSADSGVHLNWVISLKNKGSGWLQKTYAQADKVHTNEKIQMF